ncbi:hypothetical protein FC19_GL001674 [Liquorilactobacillus aquaticus DSM 21051]|uniref:Uncharacterized protein n=1 Tax=Liquorilactobacillus aquaticus DSM 21051 TaxID=1423725 RepID=A0A0R2D9I1_9LACO|nr:hypothetical protein [Liquorilactobacillus aquaticus]KRM97369.1 hypothetical protein FC19_GL001674 [Liquorilactobacillus aquaticus DSM 21051]
MNEESYLAWAEATPHIYEINFSNSVLVPQIDDFPEINELGVVTQLKHKKWRIESIVPELDVFSQCFIAIMKKHHVPTENYTIVQLEEENV